VEFRSLGMSMGSKVPTFYKIDKERRLVMTTASGVTTMDDAVAHQISLQTFRSYWTLRTL
jgi:DNA-binding CsgD family transcriptional regulator